MGSKTNVYTKKININRELIEWITFVVFFVLSFINTITLLLFFVYLLTFLKQKELGALKVINFITLRTVVNPEIAINISQFQNIKWIFLFGCSSYLIMSYFKMTTEQKKRVTKILFFILLFMAFSILTSFIFSSLPTIATFKLLSYVIVFIGILYGVTYTANKMNWINWMIKLLGILIIPSLILIQLSIGYHGAGFRGLTNQPNMFGIIAVLFAGIMFTSLQLKKSGKNSNLFTYLFIFLTFYMIILSSSRTSFIGFMILLAMFIFFTKIKKYIKYIFIYSIFLFLLLIPMLRNIIFQSIEEILYKGNENLLYSRQGQVESLMSNFLSNPWFGKGFQVPSLPYRSFALSFDYMVEPGNLLLAVLSYVGVIGFILFILYMLVILFNGISKFKYIGFLFVSPIIISMGEMVFFSSNSIGIWCYMFLAMYSNYPIINNKAKNILRCKEIVEDSKG